MKKIINWLLLVPMALMTASCLEVVEPTGYLTEDKKNALYEADSENVLAASVTGMYNNLISFVETDLSHNYFGQKSFDYLTSLMGNDMIMTNRYAMSIYHYLLDYWQHNYTPTANRWAEYYTVIKNANDILTLIDPESEDASEQYYRAVALGFRGYAYLQLTYLYQHSYYLGVEGTKWGKSATYDFSQKPCVPILLEDTEGDQPRSTLAKVHERITEDLTAALAIFEALKMTYTLETTDIDGTVVAMHLARQAMILNNWDDAIAYSQIVMENYPVLTDENDILQGFSDKNLPDVVFAGDITSDNTGIYASWFSQMDCYSDGYAGIAVWRAAFKPLVDRIPDNDVRLNWFCCERSTGITVPDGEGGEVTVTLLRDVKDQAPVEYQSVKFIGTGRNNILAGRYEGWELGDYIYLRSEEAYLMYAEALAHNEQHTESVAALNSFVQTRQPDYSYTFTDYAALVEEIIYQKRVEFWGEGMEYLDNRRLNIPVDRTDETWGAENNNHFAGAKMYVEQESENFLYQIPDQEMENNTALTPADQN